VILSVAVLVGATYGDFGIATPCSKKRAPFRIGLVLRKREYSPRWGGIAISHAHGATREAVGSTVITVVGGGYR